MNVSRLADIVHEYTRVGDILTRGMVRSTLYYRGIGINPIEANAIMRELVRRGNYQRESPYITRIK